MADRDEVASYCGRSWGRRRQIVRRSVYKIHGRTAAASALAAQTQQDRKGIEYLERYVETYPIWIGHAFY